MKGIDPKYIMYLGLIVSIEQAIGHGTVSLTNIVPATWAPYVTSWCNLLAFIGTAIMTGQAAISSNAPGPLLTPPPSTPTIVKILLAAFVLSAFLVPDPASAQSPRARPAAAPQIDLIQKMKDDFTAKTGVQATGDLPFDLLQALDKKLLPDLQYALKLAQATGSTVTAPCYQAWIDMINTQQTAVQTKNADGTTADIPTPDPHLVTDFERMVELRNALQPESKFMVACSPVANMIKQDVVSFMGKVISGGAGIAALVPGL